MKNTVNPQDLFIFFQRFGSGFFPDQDQTFFPESGSGSAKNPDPIRNNPDPVP